MHFLLLVQASSAKLRVAVIGAGASGLPAIKCCLDDGLEPVCFERSADIGGLWNYENCIKEGDGHASVMKSTVINTSKEMMCYSDFPAPAEYPNYMHNKRVVQYMRLYAEHFNLLPHIRFDTEVIVSLYLICNTTNAFIIVSLTDCPTNAAGDHGRPCFSGCRQ